MRDSDDNDKVQGYKDLTDDEESEDNKESEDGEEVEDGEDAADERDSKEEEEECVQRGDDVMVGQNYSETMQMGGWCWDITDIII